MAERPGTRSSTARTPVRADDRTAASDGDAGPDREPDPGCEVPASLTSHKAYGDVDVEPHAASRIGPAANAAATRLAA
jgi:hypothetical protein